MGVFIYSPNASEPGVPCTAPVPHAPVTTWFHFGVQMGAQPHSITSDISALEAGTTSALDTVVAVKNQRCHVTPFQLNQGA